jgi:DNA repair protein RadC
VKGATPSAEDELLALQRGLERHRKVAIVADVPPQLQHLQELLAQAEQELRAITGINLTLAQTQAASPVQGEGEAENRALSGGDRAQDAKQKS